MKQELTLLVCAAMVVGLAGSASALLVNDTQTWGATRIENLEGGGLEVGPQGNLTIAGRVDTDSGGWLRMSGGILNTTDTFKFPDSSGDQDVRMYIDAGTFTAYEIEHRGYDRNGIIFVGGGTLIVQTGYLSGSREYDPQQWLQDNTLQPAVGYDQVILTDLGGGTVEITTATPNPEIAFESPASGDMEAVSPAIIGVVLERPEEGQTYTVDYSVIGGTATAGVDYVIGSGGPLCWGYATQCHGDTDNTGDVKGSDFLSLKGSWYECEPDANYNPCADFDHDGCVKGSDFLILKDSWYQTAEANCPTGVGGTLQFNPGQTGKTIEIDIVEDGLDEDDETIVIGLSSPTGANVQLGSLSEHTYTIVDPRPYVQFDSESSYGGEDASPATIAVSLTHTWAEAITVDYEATGGTATGGGVDYNLPAGTLTVNDANEELPETIEIILSNPTSAKLGQSAHHIFTVYDDEQTGVVIGPDNILFRHGRPWFPMLIFTNNFEEVGGLVEPDPEELAWSLDHLEGTPFGMLDYATPIGGYDYTEQLADQCYLRGVPWVLSLKDLYVPDASGWPRWEERARFFPGQPPLEVARELALRLRNHPALTL
ncbi:MAG: Calx-beta domain-containing protein, partial [Planctomycetota bacterium]